jgi:sugar phosphate isomerase/epimerase
MIHRRQFLQMSIAATAVVAAGKLMAGSKTKPLGVQLYTVRDQAERDLPAVFEAIRKIGYREVELYWNIYSHPAKDLRRMLDDHGLSAPSGHFNYEGLGSKLDYAQELGVHYVVCPMLPNSMWNSLDEFKRAADQFNSWGEDVHRRGMIFGFHNHNYEFRQFGNTTGFATLMQRTDPKLVCLEMDCYWIAQAGRDPLQMFDELGSRIRLLHLKDRKPGFAASQELNDAAEHFTEVGDGNLDWKKILAAAERNHVEHLFVERDSGSRPALESIRISYDNLQRLIS